MMHIYRFETNIGIPLIMEVVGRQVSARRIRIHESALGNRNLEVMFPLSFLNLVSKCKVVVNGGQADYSNVRYGHVSSPMSCGSIDCSSGERIVIRKAWNAFTTLVNSDYEYRLTLGARENVIGIIIINPQRENKISVFNQADQVSIEEFLIATAIAVKSWISYQNSL